MLLSIHSPFEFTLDANLLSMVPRLPLRFIQFQYTLYLLEPVWCQKCSNFGKFIPFPQLPFMFTVSPASAPSLHFWYVHRFSRIERQLSISGIFFPGTSLYTDLLITWTQPQGFTYIHMLPQITELPPAEIEPSTLSVEGGAPRPLGYRIPSLYIINL